MAAPGKFCTTENLVKSVIKSTVNHVIQYRWTLDLFILPGNLEIFHCLAVPNRIPLEI